MSIDHAYPRDFTDPFSGSPYDDRLTDQTNAITDWLDAIDGVSATVDPADAIVEDDGSADVIVCVQLRVKGHVSDLLALAHQIVREAAHPANKEQCDA